MKNKKISLTVIASFIFFSCSNDSTSDLLEEITNNQPKYSSDIKSIIDNNCVNCHASTPINGAPMSLATYDDVKNAIISQGLLDRISRAQGEEGIMPVGGSRLPQQTIDLITLWANQGFSE